jgi:hypothetical protein
MKGTVVICLREMVVSRRDEAAWASIMEVAGMDRYRLLMAWTDIDDGMVGALMEATASQFGWTMRETYDAFAEFWMVDFGPRVYGAFYDGKNNAREFLEAQDRVHVAITNTMANARPPRFACEWVNDRTMIMHYQSHRGLVDLMVSFIKGVGKYYREELRVTRLGDDKVKVVFSS